MNIIFHHPLPLNPLAASASGIRPLKMLEAFQSLGYNVFCITGYANERRKKFQELKKMLTQGVKFDFLYGESSTMPNALANKNHIPTSPHLDRDIFIFCQKQNIKIGIFYRDIYWLFEDYGTHLPMVKKLVAKFFYKYDLNVYNKYIDILYLPSLKMAHYLPIKIRSVKALPPGHANNLPPATKAININAPISLVYIGGIGSHYSMIELFKAIRRLPDIKLTLCTRLHEWEAVKLAYTPYLAPNIQIVHKSGTDLINLYQNADIASLLVQPDAYRDFAVPVKLFEYIGFNKPIIATKNTLAAQFIIDNKLGWVIPYSESAIYNFFLNLNWESRLYQKSEASIEQNKHTWLARAQQVVNDLT